MTDDEVKWHDGIEPLTRSGLEEVRRHPASYAELRLVATCDEMRRIANKAISEMRERCAAVVEESAMGHCRSATEPCNACWTVAELASQIREVPR